MAVRSLPFWSLPILFLWLPANADDAIVRLRPAAFANLPVAVSAELERRGCLVPQSYADKTPHNVIRGRFLLPDATDLAVLCSRNGVSSILIFRNESAESVGEIGSRPDRDFLQVVGERGATGFSRRLGVADPKYITEHRAQYGGPALPSLDHDGINDIFVGKASTVRYWFAGRWLALQGAD